jgi:hypothetical protein
MFATETRFGAIVLAALMIALQCPASAVDTEKCIMIREQLRSARKAQTEATNRLAELKPRLDSLNKQIDDLSIKQANEFLDTGHSNPNTDKQLAQLRAEYKAITQGNEYRELQSTMRKTRDIIAVYESKRQSEGCPPDDSSSTPSEPEVTGTFEHEITFRDETKTTTMLMKTLKDYNGAILSGQFQSFIGLSKITINCPPVPEGVFVTYNHPHLYECTFLRQLYDPSNRLMATHQGKTDVKLTLDRNHKSQMVIALKKGAVIKDLTRSPPVITKSQDSEITLWEEISFK